MPARTNDFQKLVKLIHMASLPPGTKITESAMVKAPGFGDLREIDILAELDAGPYQIKIAIEAKDHRRKLNVTDIEAIIGKYRAAGSLIVNQVVLVSRNGFSNAARDKAEANGIELITLKEAESTEWSRFLPFTCAFPIPTKLHVLSRPPTITKISVSTNQPIGRMQSLITECFIACRCHGNVFGTVQEFVRECFVKLPEVQQWVRHPGQHKTRLFRRTMDGLQLVLPDARKIDLKYLMMQVRSNVETVDLKFSSHEMSDGKRSRGIFQRGSTEYHGRPLDIIFAPDGKKVVVNFGGDGLPATSNEENPANQVTG